jgi:hypothetical protein
MMTIKGLLRALELAEPTASVVFDFCLLNVDPHLSTDIKGEQLVLSWGPRICTVTDLRIGLNQWSHSEGSLIRVGQWGSPTPTTVRFARADGDRVVLVTQ